MIPRGVEAILFLGLLFLVALPSSLSQKKLKDLKNVVTDCTVVVRDLDIGSGLCDPADPAACAADKSACAPADPANCASASATACAAITGSNNLPGLCRWDAYAAFLDLGKGCVCPADAGTCSLGEGRSGCFWHVDKENDLASTCVTNANRFHNILYYHLMKRGKKNFAINIKYGATPARGVLPQGPWGPAKIGFGDPEMQLYRARLRQQQQRVNHPGSNHGVFPSFGPPQISLGHQSPLQPSPSHFRQPLFQPSHSHFGQQPLLQPSHYHFGPPPSQFPSPDNQFGPPQFSLGANLHSQLQPPPSHFGPPAFGPQPAGGQPTPAGPGGPPQGGPAQADGLPQAGGPQPQDGVLPPQTGGGTPLPSSSVPVPPLNPPQAGGPPPPNGGAAYGGVGGLPGGPPYGPPGGPPYGSLPGGPPFGGGPPYAPGRPYGGGWGK